MTKSEARQRYGIPYGGVLDYICCLPSGLDLRVRRRGPESRKRSKLYGYQFYEPGFMIHTL